MSLRVLHVLDHSIPLHSGYTFRTAALLREQRKLGWHTFHVTSPKHGASAPADAALTEQEVDDLHFFRTPAIGSRFDGVPALGQWATMRALELRLRQVAATVRPDIIHVHSPVLNALPALKVGHRLGLPVVYEVRAFWEDAAVDHGTAAENSMRYRVTRALETRALRRADHVFTICEGLQSDIVGRGLTPERVTVIPNAVDLAAFELGRRPDPALIASLGLEQAAVVGFVGSFYAYEGLDLLLRALPTVLQQLPKVRLLLVGGGPQDAALRAQAAQLGLADKVVFTGRVPHAEVGRYYDLIDVLAYPRHSMRLTELVTPLKPLEAMAQGRLLVASDVGGHRELIRDGENGVLFRAGDPASLTRALVGLFREPQRWPALRAQGRRFVENERTWTNSATRYRPVFERLTARRTA